MQFSVVTQWFCDLPARSGSSRGHQTDVRFSVVTEVIAAAIQVGSPLAVLFL